MDAGLLLARLITGLGLAISVSSLVSRRPKVDFVAELHAREPFEIVDEFQRRLAEPFQTRVLRAAVERVVAAVGRFAPRQHLERIQRRLTVAGLAATTKAEAFLARQAMTSAGAGVGGLAFVMLVQPPGRLRVLILVGAPVMGALLPTARLNRNVEERQTAILRDLPDMLDLLAISVEAGMGFEGALAIVTEHFDSPLADEFARTLQEMGLGLPRREAFQHLKARTEVPELSGFVLALLQADSLGVPIGRVLKTQSNEMRAKRRMWAREKAGKLPVKILFPLVLFVFPPIMVVILGPAASTLSKSGLS